MFSIVRKAILAVLLLGGLTLVSTGNAHAQDECPVIPADGPGVQRIDGQGTYSFYGIPLIVVDQPVVAMVDDGLAAQGDLESFPPSAGQVIGELTSDFFTTPFSFTINLPAVGNGLQVDLDQDDVDEAGVQIYRVIVGQNVNNTVPLVGVSAAGILTSYDRDSETDEIIQGAVVVYAPDDQQGFPCGYGADGKLFTDDDPIVTLPQGFTVANIADGMITFDRSAVAGVTVADPPGAGSPDFSDQGIVESFNTLTDFLRERYVFNEFKGIDWDALHAKYLPRVEEAEANEDLGAYFLALVDLAHDLFDAHVYLQPGNIVNDPKALETAKQGLARDGGGVGAKATELDDGRIIVTSVDPAGPAAAAGLEFGAELISVNGVPVADALAEPVRYLAFPGTPEAKRIKDVEYLLKQPVGTEFEITYLPAGSDAEVTTTLTSVPELPVQAEQPLMPMQYRLEDGVGYVTWPGFSRTGIATHIFADFIKVMNQQQIPGIIIDLRSNGGGSALMEYAVMSYLFDEEHPLDLGITDSYHYNEQSGGFVREPQTLKFSSPAGSQPYTGDVVMLVDQNCASACEFMSYWLQASGRADIVGQYATEGAGGNTNGIFLPGQIQFNFTEGTELDPETGLPTFQDVGVRPDVEVPVTEETERAKVEGGDPVLEAGIQHLRRLAFERLDLQATSFVSETVTSVAPATWTPDETGNTYASPDDPIQFSITAWTESDETNPDSIMLNAYPGVRKATELETDAGTWSIYGVEGTDEYTVLGVIVIDEQPYIVTTTTTDENLVTLMVEYVFLPALRDFAVAE